MNKSLLAQLSRALHRLNRMIGEYGIEGLLGSKKTRPKNVDLLARTIWGEARNQPPLGMQAVANVIMNRVEKTPEKKRPAQSWPNTVEGVVKQPYQFSMWNVGDENRVPALRVDTEDEQFRQALDIAYQAVAGTLTDVTSNAYWYHADYAEPAWADDYTLTKQIGDHLFYTN